MPQFCARTLSRHLDKAGYHRRVASRRQHITALAQAKRLAWAHAHAQETAQYWNKVVWSDECSFTTGLRGRLYVTRSANEAFAPDCIQSVYRSGRTSIMVWGAIRAGWKSPLVILQPIPPGTTITSEVYKQQVLQAQVQGIMATHPPGTIFMQDGAKVHLGAARVWMDSNATQWPRWNQGLKWPPCSPDINPIEKVWRSMKMQLAQAVPFPTTKAALILEIQRLWATVNPNDFIVREINRMPEKVQAIIDANGLATRY